MTEQANKELFRTVVNELFRRKNILAIDRYFADDFRSHNPTHVTMARAAGISDKNAVRIFFRGLFNAFPDFVVKIEHLYAEDDKVFGILDYRGTHLGPFMAAPATGKTVAIRTAEIFRIRDGQFAENWDVVDDKSLAAILPEGTFPDTGVYGTRP